MNGGTDLGFGDPGVRVGFGGAHVQRGRLGR